MKKIPPIALCFLLLYVPILGAQERGVVLRPAREEIIVTEPGKIITTVFKVTNISNEDEELVLHARLPASWVLITNEFPFRLAPNNSETQLISIHVPEGTPAQKYEITYTVQGTFSPSIIDSYKVMVVVLPVTKISVRLLKSPKYVIAGDEYLAEFAVTNESNVAHNIRVYAQSSENFPFAVDSPEIFLNPRETRKVTVRVKTNEQTGEGIRHHLNLTAETSDNGKSRAQADVFVEMVPRATGGEGRMHNLPAEMTLRYTAESNGGDNASGFQGQLSGSGTLDAKGQKHVSFMLRGPDLYKKSSSTSMIFASHDEYNLNLWTDEYEVLLGDQMYSLSSLTENSLYGRGAGGKVNIGSAQVGSYYVKTRWFDPEDEETALFARYSFAEPLKVGLNYLKKRDAEDNSTIASFESQFRPGGNTDLSLEYAAGENDKGRSDAYSLGASGSSDLLSYYARYIRSDPDYPGCYTDMDFFSLSTVIPLKYGLRINAGFRQEKRNLDLDPSQGEASFEKFYQTGIGYRVSNHTDVSLDWMRRDYSDRLPDPLFDYTENTLRVSLSQNYGMISLFTSAENGTERDNLTGDHSDIERYTANVYIMTKSHQTFGGYLYYEDDSDSQGQKTECLTLGLNTGLEITRTTRLNLLAETKNYTTPQTDDRSIYSLLLSQYLFRTHRLTLQGRYVSYKDSSLEDEYDFLTEYTIPLRIPVSKREDIGAASGYIYDEETKKAVSNVVIRLNNASTVTDSRGEFTFLSVKPGTQYLDVDSSSIGLDRITVQKTPLKVMVEGGENSAVKIGITRSASLKGQVVGYKPKSNSANGGPAGERSRLSSGLPLVISGKDGNAMNGEDSGSGEPYGIPNAVVEMKSENETLYRIADNRGHFEFEQLRPGKWVLSLSEDNLPEYHHAAERNMTYSLKPGETYETLIPVVPEKRHIMIVEEKELPLCTSDAAEKGKRAEEAKTLQPGEHISRGLAAAQEKAAAHPAGLKRVEGVIMEKAQTAYASTRDTVPPGHKSAREMQSGSQAVEEGLKAASETICTGKQGMLKAWIAFLIVSCMSAAIATRAFISRRR